ncbi:MAG: peptidylprolyl isomerase [Rhodobacteraceae bacterium]|nr:peptidylprolyl isomerase [Paracoccaceae bacterium]
MVRFIQRLAAVFLIVFSFPAASIAQNAFSAAYRVNTGIISFYDIDQRIKLLRVLGVTGPDLRQQAVDALIDERLQVEAARNFGVVLDQPQLTRAISRYAEQRNLTTERLLAQIRGRGVSVEAFEDFISAGVIWQSLIRARFGNMASPTENELNSQLNTVAVSSSSSIQLGEIALLYTERGQDATVALANQLVKQLRDGANFRNLAREYSRSRSSQNGGVIGWVAPNRLPPQLAAAVRGLGRGQVAEPIFIPAGIIIIKVLDSRTQTQQIAIPTKINVTYGRLILPHAAGQQADTIRTATRLRRDLDGCRGLETRAANYATGSGVFGPVALGQIPADIGLQLARLEPRDTALMTGDNQVSVVVLCDRVSEMTDQSRAALRNQLTGRNLQSLAEGFMQELRRSSIIEKQ